MLHFVSIYSNNISQDFLHWMIEQGLRKSLFNVKSVYIYMPRIKKNRCTIFFSNQDNHIVQDSQNDICVFMSGGIKTSNSFTEDPLEALQTIHSKTDRIYDIGSFIIGQIGNNNDIFYQDILSLYGLYFGKNSNSHVISDNPYLVYLALYRVNKYKINKLALLAQITTRQIWGTLTNLEGVYRAPSNSAIIANDKEINFVVASEDMYKKTSVTEWLDKFDYGYKSLCDTVESIVNYHGDNIIESDLTGGFDSRLALSLAIATKTTDRFKFCVKDLKTNTHELSDTKVVKLIKNKIRSLNISVKYIDDESQLERYKTSPESLELLSIGECDPLVIGVLELDYRKQVLKFNPTLNGLMGESFKGLISGGQLSQVGGNQLLNFSSFDNSNILVQNNGYLTGSYIDKIKTITEQQIKYAKSSYCLEYLFNHGWQRQCHGGFLKRNLFGPLENPFMNNLSMTALVDYNSSMGIFFDIINKAAPELSLIPFSDSRWSPINYLHLSNAKDYAQIPRQTTESKFGNLSDIVAKEATKITKFKDIATTVIKNCPKDLISSINLKQLESDIVNGTYKNIYYPIRYIYPLLFAEIIQDPIFKEHDYNQTLPKEEYILNPLSEINFGSTLYTFSDVTTNNFGTIASKDTSIMNTHNTDKAISDIYGFKLEYGMQLKVHLL